VTSTGRSAFDAGWLECGIGSGSGIASAGGGAGSIVGEACPASKVSVPCAETDGAIVNPILANNKDRKQLAARRISEEALGMVQGHILILNCDFKLFSDAFQGDQNQSYYDG
jgi:hypothetical protein